ncbi:hypothetical protein BaRGS_00002442 [Batillaria attramentaria]|uniref:Uncharacterized protein n=1 Tax=Batillaria attramentaria TaxID=370345 RepID=A0ABD0M361_9CAEN
MAAATVKQTNMAGKLEEFIFSFARITRDILQDNSIRQFLSFPTFTCTVNPDPGTTLTGSLRPVRSSAYFDLRKHSAMNRPHLVELSRLSFNVPSWTSLSGAGRVSGSP